MKMLMMSRFAVGAAGLAILLAGCNGGEPTSSLPNGLAAPGLNPAAARARYPRRLWAVPGIARLPRLLFATDPGFQTVNVYSMPTMRLVGQVGFTSPYGLCNDRNGNIWVADLYGETLTKFDRSLDITRQFHTTHGAPGTCAVDPTPGNLAVTESVPSSGGFNLVIYKHARGSGTIISNPGQADTTTSATIAAVTSGLTATTTLESSFFSTAAPQAAARF